MSRTTWETRVWNANPDIPVFNLRVFRLLYCAGLIGGLLHDGYFPPGAAQNILLIAVACTGAGIYAGPAALVSAGALLVLGTQVPHVPNKMCLVLPTLMVFALASWDGKARVPAWIVNALILILAAGYAQAAITKLYLTGGAWPGGHTVVHEFAKAYLSNENIALEWLLRTSWLRALACTACLLFELSFAVILVKPRLIPFYFGAGLAFHVISYFVLNVNFLDFYFPSYLILIDWSALRDRRPPRQWFIRA
jgi:hypothetical protein